MYIQHIYNSSVVYVFIPCMHICIYIIYAQVSLVMNKDVGGGDRRHGREHERCDEHVRQRYRVCRAVSGKFSRAEGRNKFFRELLEANSALFAGFNMEDYFPGLACSLHFLSKNFLHNKAHKTHKRWDELLETIRSDHERRDSIHRHDDGGDFTDVLHSIQKENGMIRDHVKAILLVSVYYSWPDGSQYIYIYIYIPLIYICVLLKC